MTNLLQAEETRLESQIADLQNQLQNVKDEISKIAIHPSSPGITFRQFESTNSSRSINTKVSNNRVSNNDNKASYIEIQFPLVDGELSDVKIPDFANGKFKLPIGTFPRGVKAKQNEMVNLPNGSKSKYIWLYFNPVDKYLYLFYSDVPYKAKQRISETIVDTNISEV